MLLGQMIILWYSIVVFTLLKTFWLASKKRFSLFFDFGSNYFKILNCFTILSLLITIPVNCDWVSHG